jgi:hypothetical protein
MNPKIRFNRILKQIEAFSLAPPLGLEIPLDSDEEVIGVYMNTDGLLGFILTDKAILVPDASVMLLRKFHYSNLSDIKVIEQNKLQATTLELGDQEGSRILVRIGGTYSDGRVIFAVMRFLLRVRDDAGTN